MAHLSLEKIGTNHYYYFLLLIGPFHWAKFKKSVTLDPEFWAWSIFGPKMVHLPQTNFFWKIINITLIYLLAPFLVQSFKQIIPADPELWLCTIFGPKMVHFPKWEFFWKKLVNEPCFFHSCLSTCQKSKLDINLLVKYWWLKNTEISLAESHFSQDFSQAWRLCRMLINHKNFHFTQIPDKNKDMLFQNEFETACVLRNAVFWYFGSHTTIYGPLTPS